MNISGLPSSSQANPIDVQIEKPVAAGTVTGSEFCEVNRGHSMSNDSTRVDVRKVETSNPDTKQLDRLVQNLRAKLAGQAVKIRPPTGKAFSSGGALIVWGYIARQTVQATDAKTTREAIERVLKDAPEQAAEIWTRLEPEPGPDVIPLPTDRAELDLAVSRFSELSNADRFLKRHSEDIRFVVDTGEFLIWDGKRWMRDSKDRTRVRSMMARVSRWIDQEVVNEPSERTRECLRDWAQKSEGKSVINASTDLLTTRKRIWINAADLDAKHDLLNCQNGTVDLRTGLLRPHDRNDLLTCITPESYTHGTTHDLWNDTITKFLPDNEVRDYVHRLVGYAATGFASEKAFPICWGGGNNGKGSIFETIAKRGMGTDYAVSISPDAVVNNGKQGQHVQERANIKFHGKRMALFEETADGDTLDAGAVKRMASGGDVLEARALFRESFNFNPTHSVFLMTNAEPRVNCFDLAMKTRIKFIHFGVQVKPNGKIRHQLENDDDVHRAVLAWIVEGAKKYFQEGLSTEPQAVIKATEQYFQDQDTFGQFLSECFEVAEPGSSHYSELKQDIYKRYLAWAEDQGLKHPISKIRLGHELEKRQYQNIGNQRYGKYSGLRLRLEL